jgi:hypothetical protein
MTEAAMRERPPQSNRQPKWPSKPRSQRRRTGGAYERRDRIRGEPGGPAVLYGWHTVTAALTNPARHIRKLLVTENALRRLTEDGIKLPLEPELVRRGSRQTPFIRACSPKPIPYPRPRSKNCRRTASFWCSIRLPIRTMSARCCAPRQRSPSLP